MSSTHMKACLMNAAVISEHKYAVSPELSDDAQFSSIDNKAISAAGIIPTAPYSLGMNDFWPDQRLNRILAKVDSFNTNELNEVECLEMLFYLSSRRSHVRYIAEAAIETYGSVAKVFQRPGKELRELLSMDHSMTALLAIAKSSMKFVLASQLSDRREINSYAALMNYVALDLRESEQEILRVIYLDAKYQIIRDEEVARGTVAEVPIYPKELAKRAAAYCASSIVLAHNHLGDDPTPSRNDIKATIQTQGVLQLFDISLKDHVIVARTRCFSMKEKCLI